MSLFDIKVTVAVPIETSLVADDASDAHGDAKRILRQMLIGRVNSMSDADLEKLADSAEWDIDEAPRLDVDEMPEPTDD